MLLKKAEVGPFKSINKPQSVNIDPQVTILVGMNEAGKTVFLQALEKSRDALKLASFNPIDDYPRKSLAQYLKHHETKPQRATRLTYLLTAEEVTEVNEKFGINLPNEFTFSVSHDYKNSVTISLAVDEQPVVDLICENTELSSDAIAAIKKVIKVREIPDQLNQISLTENDKAFKTSIEERIKAASWDSVVQFEVWKWLEPRIPSFLYFSNYDLLPSKMNLTDLAQKVEQSKANPKLLTQEHRSVLALLRMADISIQDMTKPGGYETLKAKIEAVSISLTDQIMEFWKQNENLEVEVDIKPDPEDQPPYNNGPNLYLRIRNLKHRGVSTPFRQRSHGFIWFFSFLVWFDSVQQQIHADPNVAAAPDLILLLDEPGLSLHALAQSDFLRYIDDLAERHQVLYTTHSPFMVPSERFARVRTVEDTDLVGTVISENVALAGPRTVFPLQAALGWSIAQNLFISERNLLVEGPADLIYLKNISSLLDSLGRTHLRDDITVVPAGGLDKVATFIALLGASGLKLVVFHDYRGTPEQRLVDLMKEKMISTKAVLNASQFRTLTNLGKNGAPTDTEDLLNPSLYLDYFKKTYADALEKTSITEAHLPPGDRIIYRIEKFLEIQAIQLRPTGGFNHYAVASLFASKPPSSLDADTLKRFEALFDTVNKLF